MDLNTVVRPWYVQPLPDWDERAWRFVCNRLILGLLLFGAVGFGFGGPFVALVGQLSSAMQLNRLGSSPAVEGPGSEEQPGGTRPSDRAVAMATVPAPQLAVKALR